MIEQTLDTRQKALALNLDRTIYGTFAEIGAGQEIARNFFMAGAASGTIAKSLSAYDMQMSDSIYGKRPGRYVCMPRLIQMMEHEYKKLMVNLAPNNPEKRFFALCDTVETINYSNTNQSHGWMGVRFQHKAGEEPSDFIIHLRLLNRDSLQQQEAIGVVGVNLLYGCYYNSHDPEGILKSLKDNLRSGRIEVDMVHCAGPAFKRVDNRLLSLFLVKSGMAEACMFGPDGNTIHPTEVLYKKDILALRGRFRPVTYVHLDMLKNGLKQFEKELNNPQNVVVMTELTLKDLAGEEGIDDQDFLDRVDILTSLGQYVLVSSFLEYFKLVPFLTRYNTGSQVALVLGANTLINIFNDKYYKQLNGGLLESFGTLFHKDVRLYLYPYKFGNEIINSTNMMIPPKYESLYKYLIDNNRIVDYQQYDPTNLNVFSHKVLEKIQADDKDWEQMVPPIVARIIKEHKLFSYRNPDAQKIKIRDENLGGK